MKLPHRRQILHLAAGVAALPALPRIAIAQAYPERPVRIVAGFPPGGVTDLFARLIAQCLSERLGRQFIVENRVGVGGSLSTETVVKAAPDGYTLGLVGANDSWNAGLYDNLSFTFVRDIAPVASIARFMGVLVASPSMPVKTVPELIAYAKANPGKLAIASGGAGSSAHLYWELLKSMTGIDMLHVPYRGEGPALVDLLGGQVQAMIPNLPPAIEYIKADKLRALAVTATTRTEFLPDVPTVGEFVPGYEGVGWVGIAAPKNTPVAIIELLNAEINRCLADAAMRKRMTDLTATSFGSSASDFSKYIVDYTDKWGKVIHAASIKL